MKHKIKLLVIFAIFALMTSCSEMIMKENGYIIEEPVTTEIEEPIISGHEDDAFTGSNTITIENEANPYKYLMPTTKVITVYWNVRSDYSYPSYMRDNRGDGVIYYLQSARWEHETSGSWPWYTYTWFWMGYYAGSTVVPSANCNSTREDEGYLKPVVVKEKKPDGTYIYRMWVTSKYKEYISNISNVYNYKYKTSCYTFNGVSWDLVTTETPYYATFNDNTHTGDKGGIVLTDIVKGKIGDADLYIGLYLGKGEISNIDENWKLYSSYSVSDLISWIRTNGSLFLGIEKSDANFDCVSIGTSSTIFDNSKYMAYYTGTNKKRSAIGYAYSGDGVNGWTKNSAEPVFKGTSGKFDEYGVMDPCIIKEDGIYKMYYVGFDGLHYRLGLAYSKDGIKFQYYDTENYKPIQLTSNIDDDIRYPKVFIDEDGSGNRQLRIFYCMKKTVTAQYTNTSGGTSLISNGTSIWKVNMALSSVSP